MKRRRLVLTVLVTIAVGFAWWRLTTHRVPVGQPPLAYLDSAALATLKADFNRAVDETRLIVLLSPT